ncbi:MAG: cyanoexosortase A system-associated protein [Cyanobacteria bacterium J06592_8]
MIKVWEYLRTTTLIFTFGTVIFVLGKSVFYPAPKQYIKTDFTFPEEVPLPGWKEIESQTVTDNIPTELYKYTADNLKLEIEMQYVERPQTNEKKFRQYDPRLDTSRSKKTVIKQQDEIGSYSLGTQENRAYLRSCLNPRGPATITYEQFIQNRYTYDWQFSRLLPVLSGREPLRDHRCLWSSLSLPLDNISEQQAYSVLEEVWFSWYQWWHPRFPEI